MKYISNLIKYFAIVSLFLSLSCPLFAQPQAGDQWIERAYAYAEYFWNCRNVDYGSYSSDCAHFTSQIANAGCAGMCESNRTAVQGWNQGDCDPYHNNWPELDCLVDVNCISTGHGSGNHFVITQALEQSWWFYCDDRFDWPWFEDFDSVDDLDWNGYWIFPGCFAFFKWNDYDWHAVFVGEGSGSYAYISAHSYNHCHCPGGYNRITLRDKFGSAQWVEVYGAVPSSPCIPLSSSEEITEEEKC